MSAAPSPPRVWGIIPAAGLSRRMGRPKQTLAFGSSTVVGIVTRTLLDAGLDGVVVVTRTELVDRMDLPSDPRVHRAINDDGASEMIDSVRMGLATLDSLRTSACQTEPGSGPRDEDGVLIMPGDMPGARSATCRHCVSAYRADPSRIVVAAHGGRRGHPIILPFGVVSAAGRLAGGLRGFLDEHPEQVLYVEVDDPGVLQDIDTPGDYELRQGRPGTQNRDSL